MYARSWILPTRCDNICGSESLTRVARPRSGEATCQLTLRDPQCGSTKVGFAPRALNPSEVGVPFSWYFSSYQPSQERRTPVCLSSRRRADPVEGQLTRLTIPSKDGENLFERQPAQTHTDITPKHTHATRTPHARHTHATRTPHARHTHATRTPHSTTHHHTPPHTTEKSQSTEREY